MDGKTAFQRDQIANAVHTALSAPCRKSLEMSMVLAYSAPIDNEHSATHRERTEP
jgi:hypothetical protein